MSITSTQQAASSPKSDRNLRAAAGAWDPVELHDVGGTRVAVSRRGAGPAVVCLHATGHGARDFELLAERVGDDFEIIAVDWPGQGRSPRESTPASAKRYARILEELLPRVADDPVILVGCSIGGAAAIEVAARTSDLVRALVLCDPGGLVELDGTTRFAINRMASFFSAGARGAWWYASAFAMYYRMVLPAKSARAQRDRIVASAYEIAPILAESWKSFAEPGADLRPLIASIGCPVFFAWATQDRVLPWARTRPAAEKFADMRVEFFRAGHAAFLEDPDRFAASFRTFAASLPAVQRGSGSRTDDGIGTWKQAGAA